MYLRMISCYYCKFYTNSLKSFTCHFKMYHPEIEHNYSCGEPQCFRVFSSWTAFKRHLLYHIKNSNLKSFVTSEHTSVQGEHSNVQEAVTKASSGKNCTVNETHDNINHIIDDTFKHVLKDKMIYFISEMYNNSLIPRNFIQFIIKKFQELFCEDILPYISNRMLKFLSQCNHCNNHVNFSEEMQSIVGICEHLLDDLDTEYKRFNYFQKHGNFIEPQDFIIGYKNIFTSSKHSTVLTTKAVTGKIIPIRKLLKVLFEKDGVFFLTQQFIETLRSSNTYQNFIQGPLWKNKAREYYENNKLVYPLFLYFDDYQVGNSLGSHSEANKLGAIYISIPCLPQHLLPALNNIFLVSLFYSKDRKHFGNKFVLNPLIEELNFLQNNGIDLTVNNMPMKLYFKLGLIMGDNLGIHSMLGFSESFMCNYSCRFCKIHRNDSKNVTNTNNLLLRTPESYKSDLNLNNISYTGLKENCEWHALQGFHCTTNYVVDVMHDIFEGICIYDISALLKILVFEYKLFTIEMLNNRLRSFNFGHENSNKPTFITVLEGNNIKIRMSANEMICFVRYLGLLIGDFVPRNLEVWQIWTILREITNITTTPNLHFTEGQRLQIFIQEYLELVKQYLHDFKPKHHHLLHYALVYEQSGPLVHLWGMLFEQKHRQSKLTSNISGSYQNIIHTLSIKAQLKLFHQLMRPLNEDDNFVYSDSTPINITDYQKYFAVFDQQNVVLLKKFERHGVTYKTNVILLIDSSDMPLFGKIQNIFVCNKKDLYISYISYETLCFDPHVQAFEISLSTNTDIQIIAFRDIHDFEPCLLTKLENKEFISVKHCP